MGLIDTVREKLPIGGEPQSDLTPADFEDMEPQDGDGDGEGGEGSEEQEEQGSENGEQEEEENESGGGSGEESEEEEQEEQNGSGGSGEQEGEEEEEGEEEGSGGEEDGEEQDPSSGGSESNESSSVLDEEEREQMKEEMEETSAERDMTEWTNADDNYHEPSKFIQRHYEQLQEKRADPETEIEKRKANRDERMETVRVGVNSETVLDKYDDRFADEISEAFRKIKTRSTPEPSEYGQRVNMRGVVRSRAGDKAEEKLYLEMEPSESGDRCITVVVDGSGSMDGLEIKLALMAIADATEQIGDRFAAVTYDTDTTGHRRSYNIRTNLITGPTESFEDEHLDSFKAHGYTPTASGIEDGRAITDITPNSEDVIIVITDGVANISMDGEKHDEDNYKNPAMKEASDQVGAAINEGKRVIGLGVGQHLSDEAMREIFGPNYFRADMDEIADTLVEIYRDQMETTQ